MFQSKIVQKFIRSKLQEKLNSFFELQNSTIDGLTIRNIVMKPDILSQLSQIIKIPFILKSGSIQSVSLNIPWDNLFSVKKDQSISVLISGIKISAKLPNNLQREYIILCKKKIIEKFTQQFSKNGTSRLNFINKLKQYFFGTFCIEVKNLELEFNLDLKHSLIGILSVNCLRFQKDMVNNKTKFEIMDLSLGYKFAKQIKQQYIINNADITMKGSKDQGVDIDHFQTKKLQISFNNQNFNDVRRLIALIKWHNSFVDIPEKLWQFKPFIIGEIKPSIKLKYISQIILYKVKQKRPKQLMNILKNRRQYIKLFEQFRRDPTNAKTKYDLNQLQQRMEVWRVKQYRKFCLLWEKSYPNKPHSILVKAKNEKKNLSQTGKMSWLSYWFPKNEEKQLKQLENCLNSAPVNYNKKQFTFNIQFVKIAVSIHSLVGKQPFINIISINNQIHSMSVPLKANIGLIESEIKYENNKKITVQKMHIQYDKYLGHHEDHKYLLSESIGSVIGQNQDDQFEDIQNFLQWEISKDRSELRIMPIQIRANEDTLQKISVFKFQRIHNTFQSAQTLVLQQNAYDNSTSNNQKKNLNILGTLLITLPENMCQKQCQQIQIGLYDINFTDNGPQQSLNVKQIVCSASLNIPQGENGQVDQSSRRIQQSMHYQYLVRPQKFNIFQTSFKARKQIHQSLQQTYVTISPIKIAFSSVNELKQLIRLMSKMKPRQKQKIPLYKLKNLRRKQSIGEQFIDACENLQEHLIKSKTFSEKTRYEKYIVKDKKDKKYQIQLIGLKVKFEYSQIELTKTTVRIFQFPDYKSISIDKEQKSLCLNLQNIRNFKNNLTEISNELSRILQLNGKMQNKNKRFNQIQSDGNQLQIAHLNIQVKIFYNKKLKIIGEINNVNLQIKRDQNIRGQVTCGLAFNIYKKQALAPLKQYTVEPFKLNYHHEKGYNKDDKLIRISDIIINIKPDLFVELGSLFDQLLTQERTRIEIFNSTANNINISTTGNIYKQYGPGLTVISESPKCDIIIFSKKYSLSLLQQEGNQKMKLTEHISLLKTMKSQDKYLLESNFRITNRQEKSIWVRVITNKGMLELKKKFTKESALITFQNLSSAGLDFTSIQSKKPNLKRSSSLHHDNQHQSEDSNDSQLDQKFSKFKKATVNFNPKTIENQRERSLNHQLKQQVIIKNRKFGSEKSNKSQNSSDQIKTIAKQPSKKHQNIHQQYQNSVRRHEVFIQEIQPEQTVQILLSSEEYYLQFMEYNKKGDIKERYNPIKVLQILKDGNQQIIQSYQYDSFNYIDENQISSTLVVATTVRKLQKQSEFSVFQIQILSPVAVVNKMPVPFQFRFNKQKVDILQVIQSGGKQIRKKSFQVTQLQKVQPFKINRINRMLYNQISETQIYLKEYYKKFRLDHTIQSLKQTSSEIDIRIFDLLCLNNGSHEIQMGIQIRIVNNVMKITIFPQFIFVNMTSLEMRLQIKQQNYSYPTISMKPVHENMSYKSFIRMSTQRLSHHKILQKLFQEFEQNISVFTGSFEENTRREVKYNNEGSFQESNIYETYESKQNDKNRQQIIVYDSKNNRMVLRKIKIDDKPINLIFYMPSLLVINKSDWSFYIKGSGQKPKKLMKHSIEYLLINEAVVIQACQDHQDIIYNEWMKITLNTLGIIYYAKQMTSSNGYQSRQYQLRKKRLKKVPKIFFRIVLTKYEYGHQILIQQSQYPPVSFISRCQSRTQIKQATQNIIEEMQKDEVAQYASKIPHHMPKFQLSMVENYEFQKFGFFTLESPSEKIFQNRIKVTVEEYKDKKIVIIQDYNESNMKNISTIRNELLLEKLERIRLVVMNIQFSVLNNFNKQLTCTCIKDIEISHQSKNTKKYIKLSINDVLIFSYNGLQPRYLFYSKQPSHKMIGKRQVLGFLKARITQPEISKSFIANNPILNSSIASKLSGQSNVYSNAYANQILALDIVIDYHKYATILEKCQVTLSQIVVVINANTIIDYLKYYYASILQMFNMIKKHEVGRSIMKQIQQAINGTSSNQKVQINNQNHDQDKQPIRRRDSVSINNINQNMIKRASQADNPNISKNSPKKIRKFNSQSHSISKPQKNDNVNFLNRGFVIENFMWNGLKIAIKFENIENFQYFLKNSQMKLKYLFKFINWIGDLRPLQFSPTEVQYEQYTIMKLLQLIDLNKLMGELYQNFLEYPLQELNHVLSFITKIIGCNDIEDNNEQWNTLNRVGKSIYKLSKKLLSFNSSKTTYIVTKEGELKENKKYLEQFMQACKEEESMLTRIIKFKYEQWRYKEQGKQNKLNQKQARLQRYNLVHQLLSYDGYKARIQTAINDFCGNKFFREITLIQQINKSVMIGMTEDWFVLYMLDKEQWVVAKPEHVLELRLEKTTKISKNKNTFEPHSISKSMIVTLASQKEENEKKFRISKYNFKGATVTQTQIEVVLQYLKQLKLSNIY